MGSNRIVHFELHYFSHSIAFPLYLFSQEVKRSYDFSNFVLLFKGIIKEMKRNVWNLFNYKHFLKSYDILFLRKELEYDYIKIKS